MLELRNLNSCISLVTILRLFCCAVPTDRDLSRVDLPCPRSLNCARHMLSKEYFSDRTTNSAASRFDMQRRVVPSALGGTLPSLLGRFRRYFARSQFSTQSKDTAIYLEAFVSKPRDRSKPRALGGAPSGCLSPLDTYLGLANAPGSDATLAWSAIRPFQSLPFLTLASTYMNISFFAIKGVRGHHIKRQMLSRMN